METVFTEFTTTIENLKNLADKFTNITNNANNGVKVARDKREQAIRDEEATAEKSYDIKKYLFEAVQVLQLFDYLEHKAYTGDDAERTRSRILTDITGTVRQANVNIGTDFIRYEIDENTKQRVFRNDHPISQGWTVTMDGEFEIDKEANDTRPRTYYGMLPHASFVHFWPLFRDELTQLLTDKLSGVSFITTTGALLEKKAAVVGNSVHRANIRRESAETARKDEIIEKLTGFYLQDLTEMLNSINAAIKSDAENTLNVNTRVYTTYKLEPLLEFSCPDINAKITAVMGIGGLDFATIRVATTDDDNVILFNTCNHTVTLRSKTDSHSALMALSRAAFNDMSSYMETVYERIDAL